MNESERSLAAIRQALERVTEGSSGQDLDAAIAEATSELGLAAMRVARFANQLDDGTGFFNSSSEFGVQLGRQFDEVRRVVTTAGLMQALSVPEVLLVVELAMLRVGARIGPHGSPRASLSENDRRAMERIAQTITESFVDADMLFDPEDDDDWQGPRSE